MDFKNFIKKNRWFDSMILVIFISAFAVATCNHIMDLITGGLFPYAKKWEIPESFNIYWTSLTLLDPLAITTVIINVRLGYIIAITIMISNVPINFYATINFWSVPVHKNVFLLMQTAFLIFLLSTVFRVWNVTSPNKG